MNLRLRVYMLPYSMGTTCAGSTWTFRRSHWVGIFCGPVVCVFFFRFIYQGITLFQLYQFLCPFFLFFHFLGLIFTTTHNVSRYTYSYANIRCVALPGPTKKRRNDISGTRACTKPKELIIGGSY